VALRDTSANIRVAASFEYECEGHDGLNSLQALRGLIFLREGGGADAEFRACLGALLSGEGLHLLLCGSGTFVKKW